MDKNKFPKDNESILVNDVPFSHRDIHNVVDDFYTRIQNDPVLKIPFQSVHDWPEHIDRLTHFWWTRFGGKPYMFTEYNPAFKHFHSGFNRDLLKRWLEIFHATLETHLKPEQVAIWKFTSERMGEGLAMKNDMIKAAHEKAKS